MATSALRHVPLLLLAMLQLYAAGAGGNEASESCSKALGFNESSGPKDRSGQDLNFCAEHHKRTCCEKNHTKQALNAFAPHSHERSARCVQMTKLALCSQCDGDVGLGLKARLNLVILCPSFCKRWWQACAEDFFAPGGSSGHLQACTPGALVCSPLQEITEDAERFCASLGDFAVADGEEDDACFDGVPAARTRGKGPRAPWVRPERPRKPWWRRLADALEPNAIRYNLQAYLQQVRWEMRQYGALQAMGPGLVVACVVLLITWFLWKGMD